MWKFKLIPPDEVTPDTFELKITLEEEDEEGAEWIHSETTVYMNEDELNSLRKVLKA